jgi:hypothetical protein
MSTGPRVLVCGSRHWSDYSAIVEAITALEPMPSLIIHGGATGADSLAGTAAHYLGIPVQVFPLLGSSTAGRQASSVTGLCLSRVALIWFSLSHRQPG